MLSLTKPNPRDFALMESAEKGSSLGKDAWIRLKKNHLAMVSLWFFVLICIACFLIPELPGLPDPNKTHPELQSAPPFSTQTSADGETIFYLLGSDDLGRDVMMRLLHGGRISLAVGFIATAVSISIGVLYGSIAGYFGGRLDATMMRVVDILYALPFMIVVIIITTYTGDLVKELEMFLADTFGDAGRQLASKSELLILFFCIGAVEWLTMSRIVRSQVQSLRRQEFVDAAQSLGLPNALILWRHIIPNTIGPVIVYTTLTVPAVMRLEAILSFLGLGVQPPDASWGNLIKEGSDRMGSDPNLLLFPSLLFGLTLFSLNFLGDGLRDALDPKSSRD